MGDAAVIAPGVRGGTSRRGIVSPDQYWAGTQVIVILLIAVVAVRVHEFFPQLRVIKPVFSISLIGVFLLLSRSTDAARRVVVEHPISRLAFMYFGAVVLTIPFALWRGAAVDVAKSLIPGLLLLTGFMLCPPKRSTLDRLQIAFVLLLLFFVIYVRVVGTAFGGRLRFLGLYGDPNDLASVLATALPLNLAVVMRAQRPRDRAAAVLASVLLVLGIISTGSRGGTLALAAGATVFAFGLKGERGFVLLLLMVIGGAAAWVTAPDRFKDRIRSLSNLDSDYNTTAESGRKAVWRRGRLYFRRNPIVGVGAGNFATAEGQYKDETGGSGKWSAPHNAYIQAFAELGSIGGGIFVLWLLTGAKRSLPLWRPPARGGRSPPPLYRPEFLASLAAFATGAIFLSHAYFLPLFAIMGFVALADRIRQAEAAGVVPGYGPSAEPAAMRVPGQRGRLSWVSAAPAASLPRAFDPMQRRARTHGG
jgi:O-antigen ligase